MKILLLLNNDIHSATALRLLEKDLENHQIKIILSRKVGNTDFLPADLLELKQREYFEIEKNFSYQTDFCSNINSTESLQDLKIFAPDLIISIRFGQILKNDVINIPRCGVLNLHSGILPNYRGVMASFWAILNGEKNLGTTLHYINDSKIDTGEIIAFSKTEIDRNSSLLANINNLYKNGCALISQTLEKISANEKIQTINQKSLGQGNYFSYPKEDEVKRFLKLLPLF
ncbi:MAG: formyl transferase [Proteobacteria bacterium]|nr:formyl transferase [Pseudomonadota bacterium]